MRLELNKTRLTIAVLAIALGATTLSGMLKPSTDEGEALSPRVATPLKSANAIPSVDNSNATNAVVEAVIVEPVAEINPKSEAQKRAISLNERDYTSEFFDAKSDRVQTDDFGNHFVDVPQSSQTMKRYLISNWPLYSPTPQEQQDGTVEGCMSLNYYVGMESEHYPCGRRGKTIPYASLCV